MAYRKGFTLIELVVATLVLGILVAMAVPRYQKTVEVSKATNSMTLTVMLGSAHRQYMLDNPGSPLSGRIDNACNNVSCEAAKGACRLVACGYAARQDWEQLAYDFFACDNGIGGDCCLPGAAACSWRKAGVAFPYNDWHFKAMKDGRCLAFGTDVPACLKL